MRDGVGRVGGVCRPGLVKGFYDDPKTVKIRPHRQPMLKEKGDC